MVSKGEISPAFDGYVFSPEAQPGTWSQPVSDNTVSTKGGYWLIKVLDKADDRQLESNDRNYLMNKAFNDWVASLWVAAPVMWMIAIWMTRGRHGRWRGRRRVRIRPEVLKMKRQSIGIGLMGLGVIGGQVARVLTDKAEDLAEKVGCPLVLRKVKVLPQDLSRPQARQMPSQLFTTDEDEFFQEPGIDIVVEAIGGESPALEYLQRAISGGKHVVTSNKEVIAKHGMELLALAQQHGVGVHYEASVGGGIPLIAPFKHDLVANEISGIYAIINGTTNYILTRMAREGMDFCLGP